MELICLVDGVELQVDQHEVRVGDRAVDLVAAHAAALPVDRIAVESALPAVLVSLGCRQLVVHPSARRTERSADDAGALCHGLVM